MHKYTQFLANCLDYFIPKKNKKIEDVQSIEFLYISRLMVAIIFFILISNLLLTIEEFARGFVDSPKTFFLATVDVFLPIGGLFLLKKTGQMRLITGLLVVCFLVLVSFFSLNLGTTRMATHWFPVIIVAGTFIVSRKFGFISLIFSLIVFVVISFDPLEKLDLEKIKWIFENRESSNLYELMVVNCLIFAFTVVSSFAKEKMRNYIEYFKDNVMINSHYELSQSKLLTIKNISAGVAHEINNPLAIIKGYLKRMKLDFERGDLTQEKVEKFEDRVNQSIGRITGITHSLAEFGTSIFDENFEKISVLTLAEKIRSEVELSLEKQNKKHLMEIVKFDFQSSLGLIEVHQDKMVIALSGLLLNAVEAAGSGVAQDVHFRINNVDNNLIFEFENGHDGKDIFISKTDLEVLKQPFLSSKKDRIRLGMGLTLADNIISFHRGDLSFTHTDSTTLFRAVIPIRQRVSL